MTPNQHNTSVGDFYTPATAVTSDEPGRIERLLTSIYRVHRLRGAVVGHGE